MKPDLNFQVIDHGDGLVAFVKIVPVRVPVDSAASLLMKKTRDLVTGFDLVDRRRTRHDSF